jgi:glutathione-independent formaldehyde dehydrogenase
VVQTNIWLEEEPPPRRLVLGHEITGEVIELGRDVEFIKKGDIVSVPLMLPVAAVKIVKTV